MAKEANLKVRPLDDRVVVEPLEAEEKTAGGILLPDTARQKPQRGRVLAVGPGKLSDKGERPALAVDKGDEVIYGRDSGSDIEVDGREIDLPDPFENMGAKLVNAVAQKTSDVAGDGTTTATILALAIYQEGLRNITAGANPMAVKRGIDRAVAAVAGALDGMAKRLSA